MNDTILIANLFKESPFQNHTWNFSFHRTAHFCIDGRRRIMARPTAEMETRVPMQYLITSYFAASSCALSAWISCRWDSNVTNLAMHYNHLSFTTKLTLSNLLVRLEVSALCVASSSRIRLHSLVKRDHVSKCHLELWQLEAVFGSLPLGKKFSLLVFGDSLNRNELRIKWGMSFIPVFIKQECPVKPNRREQCTGRET